MPYESEMEEEKVESETSTEGGEEKDYTEDEMVEYLVNEAGTVEEFRETLEKHGWEIRKKEEAKEKGPPTDFDSIEKELGMSRTMPKLSVIRISSARKALEEAGKRK